MYIIDTKENTELFQQLRTQYQNTQIYFQRLDFLTLQTAEIQNYIQTIVMKMQYIDVFINALEMFVEKDLQRTFDINTKLYLNFMQLVRNVMDRNKGGRGGLIVNVFSNLGLQFLGKYEYENNYIFQQYLLNKQMLLSLTKAFSDEFYFQKSGVAIMSVMPVINQKLITKNLDWIKQMGLQNLLVDMNLGRDQDYYLKQDNFYGKQDFDFDFYGNTNMFKNQEMYNQYYNYDQDFTTLDNKDYLNKELVYGQQLGGYTENFRKLFDMLSFNILRVIERGQNGIYTIVGLGGIKNIQQTGNYSRL